MSMSSRRRALAAAVLAPVLVLALDVSPVRGEIAVLVTGDVLKIDAYELQGERMRLALRDGGYLTVALGRLERIVDDEIAPAQDEAAVAPEPTLGLAFLDSHRAPATPYGEILFETARRHGLNPDVMAAMARAESAFDPAAVSPKGARGLLQLMPATAARFGVESGDLFDPAHNAEAAARYLVWLRERFDGDLRRVLAAYNAGEGAVERYDGVPPYRETRGYIDRILRYLGAEDSPPSSVGSVSGESPGV